MFVRQHKLEAVHGTCLLYTSYLTTILTLDLSSRLRMTLFTLSYFGRTRKIKWEDPRHPVLPSWSKHDPVKVLEYYTVATAVFTHWLKQFRRTSNKPLYAFLRSWFRCWGKLYQGNFHQNKKKNHVFEQDYDHLTKISQHKQNLHAPKRKFFSPWSREQNCQSF